MATALTKSTLGRSARTNLNLKTKSRSKTFQARKPQIDQLSALLSLGAATPGNLIVHGLDQNESTTIITSILNDLDRSFAFVNARECISSRQLLERCLRSVKQAVSVDDGVEEDGRDEFDDFRAENFQSFVIQLTDILASKPDESFVLVVADADSLRETSASFLPALGRLPELIPQISIVHVVGISQTRPLALPGVPTVHFPPYTTAEIIEILTEQCLPIDSNNPVPRSLIDDKTVKLWRTFVEAVIDSMGRASGRTPERIFELCESIWPAFTEPIRLGEYTVGEVSKLMVRNRGLFQSDVELVDNIIANDDADDQDGFKRVVKSSYDLPYFTKWLLIASFLASHNPVRQDQTLFMRAATEAFRTKTGKVKKPQNAKSKAPRISRRLLGPQPFTLERLLAIFYAIIPPQGAGFGSGQGLVGRGSADVLTQIATLAGLRMLVKVAGFGEGDGTGISGAMGGKWRVNVGWEYVVTMSRMVRFEVEQFIVD